MKPVFFVILIFFLSVINTSVAQPGNYEECALDKTLKVQALLDSVAAVNFEANHIEGFRILLYSGNNREEANRAKERAYQSFPKADVYMAYAAPTFKVRFGDFYTRLDAWQYLLRLRIQFPDAVITKEIVIVKP